VCASQCVSCVLTTLAHLLVCVLRQRLHDVLPQLLPPIFPRMVFCVLALVLLDWRRARCARLRSPSLPCIARAVGRQMLNENTRVHVRACVHGMRQWVTPGVWSSSVCERSICECVRVLLITG
jgi:hypothetical protein